MSLDRLQFTAPVRLLDTERRRVEVVASTGDVARDDAIIEPRGWDLSFYERNPVVLWGHDDRTNPPIARTVESRITDDALIQVHEFDAEGNDPLADRIWRKVVGGMVNAVSVRWLPGEMAIRKVPMKGHDGKPREREVLVFTRGHQLLETSYVSIPADPGAVIKRADGSPIDFRSLCSTAARDADGVDSRARRLTAFAADIRAITRTLQEARNG